MQWYWLCEVHVEKAAVWDSTSRAAKSLSIFAYLALYYFFSMLVIAQPSIDNHEHISAKNSRAESKHLATNLASSNSNGRIKDLDIQVINYAY